jgi:transglutaminase-like putative cysteine protease
MAEPDDRFRIPSELVTGALVAAATLPLARLFSGGGIGGVIVGTLLASAGVAWALRRIRVPAIPAALASAAAFAWFASALWAREEMWGPFPSVDSIERLGRIISAGARAAQVEVAPVLATSGLKALIAALIWGLVWLADDAVAKLRHPLLAIAFCLPIVVFPGTLLPAGRWWFDSALFLIAAMAVLFTDERSRLVRWGRVAGLGRPGWRPGLAARMGAVVVVAAIAISPFVPTEAKTLGDGQANGSAGVSVALNPLVSIKPRLNQTPVLSLFNVTSPVPSYWRLTSLDTFDGEAWVSRLATRTPLVSNRSVAADVVAPTMQRVVQDYQFVRLSGRLLPAAYNPISVERRDGVRLAETSRSLFSASRIARGQQVRVVSLVPVPDATLLDQEFTYPKSLAPYLDLPRLPASVTALAKDVTEDQPTPFRKAIALQEHFMSYQYDENVAAGHSIENLEDFLREQRGYCEQFAGTMAILARLAGLPSRVAIGFAVGEPTAKNTYLVTTRNAHAWVEIFFPGHGWLAFEPTPRFEGGVTRPAYTRPEALAPTTPIGGSEATASPSPSAEPSVDRRNLESGDALEVPQPSEESRRRNWVPYAGAALLLLMVVALPGAAAVRRVRRRRKATGPLEHVRVVYVDFLEWCAAVRLPRWPGETPAEYARRLAEISTPAEGPVTRLATLATEALFAPSAQPDPVEAARAGAEAKDAIAKTLPRRVRVLPILGWGWWRGDGMPLSGVRVSGRG